MYWNCYVCYEVAASTCECCGEHTCAIHAHLEGEKCAYCDLARCDEMIFCGFCEEHDRLSRQKEDDLRRSRTLVRRESCARCKKEAVGDCADCGAYCDDHDGNHFEFKYCEKCNDYVCANSLTADMCRPCWELPEVSTCTFCHVALTAEELAAGMCAGCQEATCCKVCHKPEFYLTCGVCPGCAGKVMQILRDRGVA